MPSIEERLEAVTHTLELTVQTVNLLGERHAASEKRLDKIERILDRVAGMTLDHEQRLQDIENPDSDNA